MKKFVLISGGGSGIGKKIAELAIDKNFTPVLFGRRESALQEASKILKSCPYLAVDLSLESCKVKLKTFLETLSQDGDIVGTINNAGIYKPTSIEDSNEENWLSQYQVNIMTAVYLTQASLPYLKKTKGAVVNISSTLGVRPIPNASAYSASKAAMNSLTLSMAMEFAPYGVRANGICPGIVDTPIHDQHRTDVEAWKSDLKNSQPLGRVGTTEDIAPMALTLIDPEQNAWTTGALINIDGGILLKS